MTAAAAAASSTSAPNLTSTVTRLRDNPGLTRLLDRQASMERFTRWQAYYARTTRIPAAMCKNCVWWVPPEGHVPSSCRLVSTSDPPDAGSMPPTATCSLTNATPARIRIVARLRGRGHEARGLAPGNLRYHSERLVVHGEHTVPPPDVEKRLVFPHGLQGIATRHDEAIPDDAQPAPPPSPCPRATNDMIMPDADARANATRKVGRSRLPT